MDQVPDELTLISISARFARPDERFASQIEA